MPTRERKVEVKDVVKVNRHKGPGISVPEGMDYNAAIKALKAKRDFEETEVNIHEIVAALPYDGAYVLARVLEEEFGGANMESYMGGFFGMQKIRPNMISVRVGPNKTDTVQVPWGRMSLPGIEGYLETAVAEEDGFICLRVSGVVKRKHEIVVKTVVDKVRDRLAELSIYRGKAIRVDFRDQNDEIQAHPDIEFFNTDEVNTDELIFSDSVMNSISTNIFTPIQHSELCRKMGIPMKRGVLLHGTYGTGKTLAAKVASKFAVDNGKTFLYINQTKDLPIAIRFARRYGPCVIFAEDIDRVTSGGRTSNLDEILNTIDGVDTKNQEVIVVLTTNNIENINKAMLRPGRLDAIIEVLPPDADAAAKLVETYGRGELAKGIDLKQCGEALAGLIPAVIREAVERSKLAAVRLDGGKSKSIKITTEAILEVAQEVRNQNELVEGPKEQNLVSSDSIDGRITTIVNDHTGPAVRKELRKAGVIQ